MDRYPTITIVTPSYNQGRFLEETIRSVLLQGYPKLEYLVMDGGSTDHSIEIIKKYEPWLTHWVSETDEGQADAIRKGFSLAKGQVMAWINSDDYYEPDALWRVAHIFAKNPKLAFVNGDVNRVNENGRFQQRIFAMRPSAFFAANLGRHGWPQQGCFWRRTVYIEVGGIDPTLQFCMDKDLFVRLVSAGTGQRVPGPPLANFRFHPRSKSSTLQAVAKTETAAIIEKYGETNWSSHPRLMSVLWWLYSRQSFLRMRLHRILPIEY